MPRSVEVLSRLVDASYLRDAPLRALFVTRIGEGLIAIRLDFANPFPDALGWAFNTIGRLLESEAIAAQSSDRVLVTSPAGLPEQIERSAWIASTQLPTSLVAPLESPMPAVAETVLLLVKCSVPLDPTLYIRALQGNTWIGSSAPKAIFRDSLPLSIRIGAGFHHVPNAGEALVSFMIGNRLYGCRASRSTTSSLFLRRFSGSALVTETSIDIASFLDALGIPQETYYGLRLDTNLSFDVCIPQEISAKNFLDDIQQSSSKEALKDLAVKHIDERHAGTAKALEQRAKDLTNRRKVLVLMDGKSSDFGLEPTNENETVILAARLESEIAKFFFSEFRIREYTAREGIDSIVRIKRSVGEPARDSTAEFEFDFRNFFRHRHPLQQVDLIICWQMSDVTDGTFRFGNGDYNVGRLVGQIQTFREWMKVISFDGHSITVIPLCRLPNLRIE